MSHSDIFPYINHFLDLVDTPNDFAGFPEKAVFVNASANAIAFGNLAGKSVALDTTNFTGALSPTEDTLQKAMDVLDKRNGPYHIDGGRSDSVYTLEQVIDCGGA